MVLLTRVVLPIPPVGAGGRIKMYKDPFGPPDIPMAAPECRQDTRLTGRAWPRPHS